ncbi:MAG: hypothetical protein KAS62_00770 [Candidatus Delongbacteria bacterium]|nr:hypothetical protein [Candidatus Delongbacteria bacterium]
MKNLKLLFLGALVCGFALNSNAQSVTCEYETYWNFPTLCDGDFYFVSGMVHGHRVDHYNPKTDVLEWYKWSVQSEELVWTRNDEVFSVNFFHKSDFDPDGLVQTFRFNLRGDQGSHILFTVIKLWDDNINKWVILRKTAKCF